MKPVYVVTGTPSTTGEKFRRSTRGCGRRWGTTFRRREDQGRCAGRHAHPMHQWIKQESVVLLIGNTYGKYIARDEAYSVRAPWLPDSGPGWDIRTSRRLGTKVRCGCWRRFWEWVIKCEDRDAPEERFELTDVGEARFQNQVSKPGFKVSRFQGFKLKGAKYRVRAQKLEASGRFEQYGYSFASLDT